MDTGETLSGERNDTATPQNTVLEKRKFRRVDAIKPRPQRPKRLRTYPFTGAKMEILSNGSEWRLAEQSESVPDLVPTQESKASSENNPKLLATLRTNRGIHK